MEALCAVCIAGIAVVMKIYDAGPSLYMIMLAIAIFMMTILLFFQRDMELKYPNTEWNVPLKRLRPRLLLMHGDVNLFANTTPIPGMVSPKDRLQKALVCSVLIYVCLIWLALGGRQS